MTERSGVSDGGAGMDNRDSLWEKFAKTGAVADYLRYSAAKNEMELKNADNRRNCS